MNVPTANVIVAFDKASMEKLFSAGATYSSLVKEISDGNADALLFNNVSNPNFLSFEHENGFGGGFKMTLSLIDPKGEFERRFISNNPLKVLQGLSNPILETTKSFIEDENKQLKDSLVEFKDPEIAEIKKRLTEEIATRDIFVAYGIGNNLDLWSGPHRCVLVNSDVEVQGARKITITLVPTSNTLDVKNRKGAYNEKVNLNLYGLDVRFSGNSKEIKFKESPAYDPVEYLDEYADDVLVGDFRSDVTQRLTNIGFSDVAGEVQRFDFHSIVVDCIRNYVQKATSHKNVIVLLPDLNVICRQAINDALGSSDAQVELRITRRSNPNLNQYEDSAGNKPPGPGSYVKNEIETMYEARLVDAGENMSFITEVLENFGIKLSHVGSSNERTQAPHGSYGVFVEIERGANADARFEQFFQDKTYYASLNVVSENVPDHVQVLTDLFNKINSMSRDSQKISYRTLGMTETETDILKIWGDKKESKWSKGYTFAGYDDFEEDGAAIIVGDDSLIKQYLYGATNLQTKEKEIQELKKLSREAKKRRRLNPATQPTGRAGSITGADLPETLEKKIEETELKILAAMPLHPLDRAILTNKEYNRQIREIVYPRRKSQMGPFGNISELPDAFALENEELVSPTQKLVEETNIPVFRYNTANPNVLDLNFKFGGAYLAALRFGFMKKADRFASKVVEGAYPDGVANFPIRGIGAAVAYLVGKGYSNNLGSDEQQTIIELLANRISPDLVNSMKVKNEVEAAQALAAHLLLTQENNLRGIIEIDQYLQDTPNNILADISSDMFRKAVTMGITTLPMFHISGYYSLGSPCLVFAQDQDISQTIKPVRTIMNKFFSGLYRFTAFKHTISTSTVSSEFMLAKNVSDYSNEE